MRQAYSMRRGDVVRVRLDPVEGLEGTGERPALVISPSIINDHGTVVIVAPLTSRKTERVYPFEALLEPPEGGLRLRSKVMLRHLRSIDSSRITGISGSVRESTMSRVEAALKIATGLTRV